MMISKLYVVMVEMVVVVDVEVVEISLAMVSQRLQVQCGVSIYSQRLSQLRLKK